MSSSSRASGCRATRRAHRRDGAAHTEDLVSYQRRESPPRLRDQILRALRACVALDHVDLGVAVAAPWAAGDSPAVLPRRAGGAAAEGEAAAARGGETPRTTTTTSCPRGDAAAAAKKRAPYIAVARFNGCSTCVARFRAARRGDVLYRLHKWPEAAHFYREVLDFHV